MIFLNLRVWKGEALHQHPTFIYSYAKKKCENTRTLSQRIYLAASTCLLFLLCFQFFLSVAAAAAIVLEVLEEASAPIQQDAGWRPVPLNQSPVDSAHCRRPRTAARRNFLRHAGFGSRLEVTGSGCSGGCSQYLVLSVSRQDGRYLSNNMVRLAFSDWTSLLSIQLATGGFQPRSAGLMYRIPAEEHVESANRCLQE